jgi:hypothetical protein
MGYIPQNVCERESKWAEKNIKKIKEGIHE